MLNYMSAVAMHGGALVKGTLRPRRVFLWQTQAGGSTSGTICMLVTYWMKYAGDQEVCLCMGLVDEPLCQNGGVAAYPFDVPGLAKAARPKQIQWTGVWRGMRSSLLIALVVLLLSACTITGGDLIVRVSGRIPEVTLTVDDRQGVVCKMDAVSPRTDERSTVTVVATNFSVPMMMVVGPEAAPYFFEVSCDDGARYRSRELLVGGRQSRPNGIDVGELQRR
jgi:hypothetical protein